MSLTNPAISQKPAHSDYPLQGVDYVELYVGNARQAAHYYSTAFGFTPIAYAGLETGVRDRASYVLQQGESFLVVTEPLTPDGPIAEYIRTHGDGVKDIAFRVSNVERIYEHVVQQGAQAIQPPTVMEDDASKVTKATISVYGDVVHSFIQRDEECETLLPTYQKLTDTLNTGTGIDSFDHFAISLPAGEVERWFDFYTRILGFSQLHEEDIATEYSAMNSIAVQDSSEKIKFVLIEPKAGRKKSQIEEFLKYHHGPGVQHVAVHTEDIIGTIRSLEANGVNFVSAPESYYDMLPDRIGTIDESPEALKSVNVLVDKDEWGYLLQIFSLPIQSRPTLFIEVIQRKNARGFGSGNIQALFKALEQEQAKRGNL